MLRRLSREESDELPDLLFGQLSAELSGEEPGGLPGELRGPSFRELLSRVSGELLGK